MKGSPLLRALVAFVIIALCGIPIRALTLARTVVAQPSEASPAPSNEATVHTTELRLEFTAPAANLKVLHLGREILSLAQPAAELEQEVAMPWPSDGVDLRFQVDWPENAGLAAMRVRITGPGGEEYDQSIWGSGPTDEVLTFK